MTPGENWIKLLRAYGPIPDDNASEAEHVNICAQQLGQQRLSFEHPKYNTLLKCFNAGNADEICSTVLTGTAGDGKTTLCYELIKALTGKTPSNVETAAGIQTLTIASDSGPLTLTVIYDLTGWRKKDINGHIIPEQVALMEKIIAHPIGTSPNPFLIAVNDGQIHEALRALPDNCSENLRKIFADLIELHSQGLRDSQHYPKLKLIDLSRTPSDQLMRACLDGLLKRPEWECIETEKNSPLFSSNSPIPANYRLLCQPQVQSRLLAISQIADANRFHFSVRSILMLLVNAILGHPKARHRLLNPGSATNNLLQSDQRQAAALHLNLFGVNLPATERASREMFRFLSLLHSGEETTNDIDELLIFGSRDEELTEIHKELVATDPFGQSSTTFQSKVLRYILGEIDTKETKVIDEFLGELSNERRRIFLHATDEQMEKYHLWCTTVYHYAGHFLKNYINPLRKGDPVKLLHLRKLAAGLNRVWTGLYISEEIHDVFLATGLDMTTSPISDILLKQLSLTDSPPGLTINATPEKLPLVVLQANGKTYSFELTMLRFEFLMRVAEGAMPSSFSREAYEDLLALKQCALRDLDIRPHTQVLDRLRLQSTGNVHKEQILLADEESA